MEQPWISLKTRYLSRQSHVSVLALHLKTPPDKKGHVTGLTLVSSSPGLQIATFVLELYQLLSQNMAAGENIVVGK